MKTDRQVDNNHKYHVERIKGKIIIKDDTLAKEEASADNSRINQRLGYISNYSNLFGSIIIILVAVSLIRILYNGTSDTITFGALLDLLKDVPQVSNGVKGFVQQLQIPGPWVVLDGIRSFINLNLSAVSIVIWLSSSLIDVCIFISYFLLWLFV